MISIIIPALNEATNLLATCRSLQPQTEPHEIIVVDAQSEDATREVGRAHGARVIEFPVRQRAAQMNAGARVACGEVLFFLHADTRLSPGCLVRMRGALHNLAVVGGGFVRRYDSASPLLRLTCALAEVRTRCFGWFLGDQGIFVRRSVFETLDGFREWELFEDLDFSRRMARVGRVVTLRPPVISSARRFVSRGAFRTTWNDLRLTARYLAGQSAAPGPPIRSAGVRQPVLTHD